jgi:hypothetical protein
MAADIVRNFHQELMAEEKKRVALRIANGTKASSPQIVSFRRQNPEYTGAGGDAQGSFNRPFFANKDESDKVLSGGVLRHFQYAQKILGQRAKDTLARQAAAEGVPEGALPQGEPPVLDERESRELELNQLLSALQDEVESGNISQVAFSDIKAIPRLLIALVPSFTPEELTRLLRFVGDMRNDIITEQLRAQGAAEQQQQAIVEGELVQLPMNAAARAALGDVRTNVKRLAAFLDNMYNYIRLALDNSGLDPKSRVAKAKALGKQMFDPKKIFVISGVPEIREPGAPGRPRANPTFITGLEEESIPVPDERAPPPRIQALARVRTETKPRLLQYARVLIPDLNAGNPIGAIRDRLERAVRTAKVADIRRAFNITQ